MRKLVNYIAQVGLILGAGGFLLALMSGGDVGVKNNFGSFMGFFGLAILAAALAVSLITQLYLVAARRRKGE